VPVEGFHVDSGFPVVHFHVAVETARHDVMVDPDDCGYAVASAVGDLVTYRLSGDVPYAYGSLEGS
jgi:hypothetical protein